MYKRVIYKKLKFILDDFWILTKTGVLIYHYLEDKVMDDQFFGMLLSAINTFAEQISDGGLSCFDLADKRYSFIEKNDIIFLGSSNTSIKEKNAQKEIESIIKLFFKFCPEDLISNWNGDLSIFSTFKSEMVKMKK